MLFLAAVARAVAVTSTVRRVGVNESNLPSSAPSKRLFESVGLALLISGQALTPLRAADGSMTNNPVVRAAACGRVQSSC